MIYVISDNYSVAREAIDKDDLYFSVICDTLLEKENAIKTVANYYSIGYFSDKKGLWYTDIYPGLPEEIRLRARYSKEDYKHFWVANNNVVEFLIKEGLAIDKRNKV